MKDRKLELVAALLACTILGILGTMAGRCIYYETWSGLSEYGFERCLQHGSLIGISVGIVAALLLLAAAKEKLWLVILVGCVLAFGSGCYYEWKDIKDFSELPLRHFKEQ